MKDERSEVNHTASNARALFVEDSKGETSKAKSIPSPKVVIMLLNLYLWHSGHCILHNLNLYFMSLLNKLMGNASAVKVEELANEFAPILIPDEEIESAFVVWRDKWVFTNKRLILLDVQGITGGKREYMTIPYRSVDRYSIETAGTLDDDCEMKIWIKGMSTPLVKEFKRNTDIKGLQRALSLHVL